MTSIDASAMPEPAIRELDALVLALNEELALLNWLHYRLTALRLLLLDGDPRFIQRAAEEVDDATSAIARHEGRTVAALVDARSALQSTTERLIDLALEAPESHRRVLVRLAREIETTSRSLAALRDTVRRQAESGQRAADAVLDLTEARDSGDGAGPGQLFHGAI